MKKAISRFQQVSFFRKRQNFINSYWWPLSRLLIFKQNATTPLSWYL